ncbi:hypothetical protein V8C44DRAFT_342441 [Trichoderma aethiopicum]
MLRLLPLCLYRFASFLPFRLSDYLRALHCILQPVLTISSTRLQPLMSKGNWKEKSYITNIHGCMKPAIALYPDKARHGRWFTKGPIHSPSPPGRAADKGKFDKAASRLSQACPVSYSRMELYRSSDDRAV